MSSRLRRGPSIPYHSSGIREAKERTVQRSTKSFVIVIPPAVLLQDHGQLGHTLSLGPRHRLAQDNGITSTPRISEDSWQMIWGWGLSPETAQRPPICGKLEFDIDLRYARWYHAWVSSSHREQLDVPMSVVPSTAPSLAHFRTDSRNTDVEISPNGDQGDEPSVTPQSTARHIPRKLSLLDRLDSFSHRSFSRPQSRERSALSPPEQVVQTQVLSPIFQEEEPKTAKQDLEKRVNNWRVSASLTATSLAIKQGQTSLEPANIPNDVPIDDAEDSMEDEELNLDDFTWSVSSQGPPDYDEMISIASWDRVPSVHLAHRNQGSVCMTPSTATSFGPSDYTLPSPAPSSLRIFTPDIACRLFEEVPLTPSTATSWGPPSEYPPSPFTDGGISSVDLPYRLTFSRPATPTTATSWGPSSWPPSPVESVTSQAISVHLVDRGVFSRPATPSTATSWGAPLSYPPSPTTPFYVSTPDAGHRAFDEGDLRGRSPWTHGWPYHVAAEVADDSTPWNHTWPYHVSQRESSDGQRSSPINTSTHDANAPWEHGWPYHSSQQQPPHAGNAPHPDAATEVRDPWEHGWPYCGGSSRSQDVVDSRQPWSLGWPYHVRQAESPLSQRVLTGVPSENSQPWVHNWPYRARTSTKSSTSPVSSSPWNHGWPYTQKQTTSVDPSHDHFAGG
ncbi:hypothetical protein V5O48_007432, partial [Marasmius crinis-equi]